MTKPKTLRKLAKTNSLPKYKHTCEYTSEDIVKYLEKLPETASCWEPKYFEKSANVWVDVTHKVAAY